MPMPPTLPTLFVSHGSPMHAINAGAAGEVWAQSISRLPKPAAILMVTAHWESSQPMLSGNRMPSMIYDFSGFPEALYKINYPAAGSPQLAGRAVALLQAVGLPAAIDDERGLDHGSWVPLLKMFPAADVPVVQLSVQPSMTTRHHFDVGRALAPLTAEGVLIVGSGHLTHNLRDWMHSRGQTQHMAYAVQFQRWVNERLLADDVDGLIAYREGAVDAVRAHPTEEHFLPLFVALGAAGASPRIERLYDGFEGNALAMDMYRFG